MRYPLSLLEYTKKRPYEDNQKDSPHQEHNPIGILILDC